MVPQVLFHDDGSVKGIATNDVGIQKDGAPKVNVCLLFNKIWCSTFFLLIKWILKKYCYLLGAIKKC